MVLLLFFRAPFSIAINGGRGVFTAGASHMIVHTCMEGTGRGGILPTYWLDGRVRLYMCIHLTYA